MQSVLEQLAAGGHEQVVFVSEPAVGLRAIIAMFVCAVVGRGVGWVLRRVYDEHTANYQAAVPIPRVPSMSELQSTGSPPDVGT